MQTKSFTVDFTNRAAVAYTLGPPRYLVNLALEQWLGALTYTPKGACRVVDGLLFKVGDRSYQFSNYVVIE